MALNTHTNVSVDVLNRIRSNASVNYQTAVPIATANADTIREIGNIIIDSPNLQNEFLHALIDRIGKVIIKQRMFTNPLSMFNKGEVRFGTTVEEIFVNLADAHQYDMNADEKDVFSIEPNDVKSAFHVLNSTVYYKRSITRTMLENAFLSIEGVSDMITALIDKMYTSYNFDQFLVFKYMIAKAALNGTVGVQSVSKVTDEASAKGLLKAVKQASNDFAILSKDFNTAGVYNSSDKEEQYLIIDNANDACLSVDALAFMFGAAFADNDAKKVRIDGFDKIDFARLNKVLGVDQDPFTSDEILALGNIEAVLVDWSWFQVYYKLLETRYIENPASLNENTWLHAWNIYSQSPFENCLIFASGTNGVSAVVIDETTAPTVTHGVAGSATIDASVTITGLAPKLAEVVNWSVSATSTNGKATITEDGKLSWNNAFAAEDTIVVTCTSASDSTKRDSVTITVA